MGTALQKARDAAKLQSHYFPSSNGYGKNWLLSEELFNYLGAAESFEDIAKIYLRVADECPESNLAGDALYWSAFSWKQYDNQRHRFLHSPSRKQKRDSQEIKREVDNLMTRLVTEYPDGDFAERVPDW